MKNVWIVGGGALGSLVAWWLRERFAVTVLCRSNAPVVRARGFLLEFDDQTVAFSPRVETTLSPITDAVVLTVRSTDNEALAELLASSIAPEVPVFLFQNGLHNERVFSHPLLLRGVPFVMADEYAPGRVRVRGQGRVVVQDHPSARALFEGSSCFELHPRCSYVVWNKLIATAAISPLAVLTERKTLAAILEDPSCVSQARAVMKELATLARCAGEDFPEDHPERLLSVLPHIHHRPSIARDVERGRSTEVEVLVGNAVRFAAEQGLAVPALHALYDALRLVDLGARTHGTARS